MADRWGKIGVHWKRRLFLKPCVDEPNHAVHTRSRNDGDALVDGANDASAAAVVRVLAKHLDPPRNEEGMTIRVGSSLVEGRAAFVE